MKFTRFVSAVLVSIFAVTSTHSVALAAEQASIQVGQAATPNVTAIQLEIARGEALKIVRALRASGRYSDEQGIAQAEKVFLQDFSQGFKFAKPLMAQQVVGSVSEEQAQVQWAAVASMIEGTPGQALYAELSAKPELSAKDRMMGMVMGSRSAAMKKDLRADVREAGSVSRYLASAEQTLENTPVEAGESTGGFKPSDIGKFLIAVGEFLFVAAIVGLAVMMVVVIVVGLITNPVGILMAYLPLLIFALAGAGFFLICALLQLGFNAIGDWLRRLANGEFDPKPETPPAPAEPEHGLVPAFR